MKGSVRPLTGDECRALEGWRALVRDDTGWEDNADDANWDPSDWWWTVSISDRAAIKRAARMRNPSTFTWPDVHGGDCESDS